MGWVKSLLVPALVGAGAAMAVSLVRPEPDAAAESAPERERIVQVNPSPGAVERAAEMNALTRRMRALERELEARETEAFQATPDEPGEPTQPAAAQPPTSPEHARVSLMEHLAEREAHHADTSFDASWSQTTTAAIIERLDAALPEHGGAVRDIDCRSVSCVVSVDLDDEEAFGPVTALLAHQDYGQSCMTLATPVEDADGPVVRLLLECDR